MTITNYSNAIVGTMLGWLKGLANWVLRLFNLAGGTSPLYWLAHNWLKLLIFFMILGVGMDFLVWLIRWRPYWVWFRKERVIVNDDKFFAAEELDADAEWNDDSLEENWQERDYVVASTLKRPGGDKRKRQAAPAAPKRHPSTLRPERRNESEDSLFDVDMNRPESTDFYEDEVFNVSNLPNAGEYQEEQK